MATPLPQLSAAQRTLLKQWLPGARVVRDHSTHGDWQPRNWLMHDRQVSVIDFGRAAMRPVLSDWVRLEARDFREDSERERAFVEGYGADPREPGAWFRERLREAINTAVWAHSVGDEAFETQGHERIERALSTHDA